MWLATGGNPSSVQPRVEKAPSFAPLSPGEREVNPSSAPSPSELPLALSLKSDGLAAACIAAVTLGALYVFYSRGLTNVYGDAIAHMEGARRIFHSLTPGYEEIGTVWLPLFH